MKFSETFQSKLRFFIKEFNDNTCLPGFKYASRLRSKKGKIIWYALSALMVALCFYLIHLQYSRFRNNITQLSFESNGYPVWKSPFPAVTICNVNAVHRNQTFKISNILLQYGFTKIQTENFFKNLNKLVACNNCVTPVGEDFDLKLYSRMLEMLQINGYSTRRLMSEVAQPCSSMLNRCIWNRKDVKCSAMFQQVMSPNGFCCSFNYNEFNEISAATPDEKFRYYTAGVGEGYGLELWLDPEENQYMSTIKPFVGFYVLAHPSHDIPTVFAKGTALHQGKILLGGIDVEIIESNWDVKYLSPGQRNCFFTNEKQLDLSRLYTLTNCVYNCRKNAIQRVCNCVPFYFQSMVKEKLCTLADAQCLMTSQAIYGNIVIKNEYQGGIENRILKRTSNTASSCYCLENCDDTTFQLQTQVLDTSDFVHYPNPKATVLKFYYNNLSGSKTARKVIYTWDLLLASIGGIFAFCICGSLLSVVEIAYLVVISIYHKDTDK